ncbi:hypothetical protein Tco_0641594 [Tanacetum coccineum]
MYKNHDNAPKNILNLSVISYSNTITSVGPSHKRCRSPATYVPSSAHSPAALSSVRADRLPPHKRFRSSPAASLHEETVEDTVEAAVEVEAKPFTLPVHNEPDCGGETRGAQGCDSGHELRQSMMAHFTDRESLRRMETFLCRRFDYHP